MNSYERVKAAVSHQTPDRVPCDFLAEAIVWKPVTVRSTSWTAAEITVLRTDF